jgi:hypothetical protein
MGYNPTPAGSRLPPVQAERPCILFDPMHAFLRS